MDFLKKIRKDLESHAEKNSVKELERFFKTGPGEYAEGDKFLGVKVPQTRSIAKKFYYLKLKEIQALITSPFHEERLTALLILVEQFEKASTDKKKEKIFKFYIKNFKYINNWDLVDLTAHKIAGMYLLDKDKSILKTWAKSKNLWVRRISIISTFAFFKSKKFNFTLQISKILLNDPHDLIHKAVGWALREVGKRDLAKEEKFLKKHYQQMPRTMLRYAIERFPESLRLAYLKGTIPVSK